MLRLRRRGGFSWNRSRPCRRIGSFVQSSIAIINTITASIAITTTNTTATVIVVVIVVVVVAAAATVVVVVVAAAVITIIQGFVLRIKRICCYRFANGRVLVENLLRVIDEVIRGRRSKKLGI